MSTEQDAESELTDEIVVEFLRRDPGFFERNPQVLAALKLTHDTGNAISLIEHQVSILRSRNMQMRRRTNELMQTARANDELFAKTRTLTLELLHVDTWHELNETLATYVLVDFQADFVCCHLSNLPVCLDHLRRYDGEPLTRRFSAADDLAVCASLRADELTELFPVQEHSCEGSAVLAPLTWQSGAGCLAIGSRDKGRFTSDMDTLFVTYIADVLSQVIGRLAA